MLRFVNCFIRIFVSVLLANKWWWWIYDTIFMTSFDCRCLRSGWTDLYNFRHTLLTFCPCGKVFGYYSNTTLTVYSNPICRTNDSQSYSSVQWPAAMWTRLYTRSCLVCTWYQCEAAFPRRRQPRLVGYWCLTSLNIAEMISDKTAANARLQSVMYSGASSFSRRWQTIEKRRRFVEITSTQGDLAVVVQLIQSIISFHVVCWLLLDCLYGPVFLVRSQCTIYLMIRPMVILCRRRLWVPTEGLGIMVFICVGWKRQRGKTSLSTQTFVLLRILSTLVPVCRHATSLHVLTNYRHIDLVGLSAFSRS